MTAPLDRREIEVETLRRVAAHVHDMAERGGSPAVAEALHAVSRAVRRWADNAVDGTDSAFLGGDS
jgi:hypothetical protein